MMVKYIFTMKKFSEPQNNSQHYKLNILPSKRGICNANWICYVEDRIQNEFGNFCPEFDACKGNPQTFKIMRLQSKASIKYDEINGPFIEDDEYFDLCEDLLRKASSERVDILLTPELFSPLKCLDKSVLTLVN